ncbi:MAG: SPOR domain-containing protein [Desulfobacterales bacterium]|nr:SPOR domain-containing protein [Desulfobacterales bacterium]
MSWHFRVTYVLAFLNYQLKKPWRQPRPAMPPYTLQISASQNCDRAIETAQAIRADGDPAFCAPADIPNLGTWYRIFIGRYPNHQAAAAATRRLRKRFSDMRIVHQPWALAVDEITAESDRGKKKLFDMGCLPDPSCWLGAFATAQEAERLAATLGKIGIDGRVIGPVNPEMP